LIPQKRYALMIHPKYLVKELTQPVNPLFIQLYIVFVGPLRESVLHYLIDDIFHLLLNFSLDLLMIPWVSDNY